MLDEARAHTTNMSRTTGKSSGKVFPANAAMAALLAQEEQDKATQQPRHAQGRVLD